MHELALCDALLKMVRDISREEALDGVRSITVRVATLSGVIPHFLTDCWVAVTDGTEYDGVPLRVEIGPKDIEAGHCVAVRRDNGEKVTAKIEGIVDEIKALLDAIHDNMYTVAEKNLEDNTFDLKTIDEVKEMASGRGGFARTKWCGSLECELKMKEQAGVSSRCMPLKQSGTTGKCVCCGKECTTDIYWGVAY